MKVDKKNIKQKESPKLTNAKDNKRTNEREKKNNNDKDQKDNHELSYSILLKYDTTHVI